MDPRRLLTLLAALPACGCAVLGPAPDAVVLDATPATMPAPAAAPLVVAIPAEADVGVPYLALLAAEAEPAARPNSPPEARPGAATGRAAIAAANAAASAPSRADGFVGGVQVFAYAPGRVYEVWTAPLRVTTLTLGAGETLVSKAAGDTVRWQIGDTSSGGGDTLRTHVLLKPLERGLETNLVLTTNRRVYLLELRSGAADAFNAAVAWDEAAAGSSPAAAVEQEPAVGGTLVEPEGPLDGRYRIEPKGRRPRWTPASVVNDGRRTFIAFDADLEIDEAPVLFVIAPDGEAQMVNYRQQGGLFVVDRVFDQAELRLGGRRPQVVRIRRLTGGGR